MDVFISYSRKDYIDENKNVIPGNVVSKIKDKLSEAGISFWFDETGINHGDNFVEKIVTHIEQSDVFLYILVRISQRDGVFFSLHPIRWYVTLISSYC